jgi:hypothetical protein
MRACTRSQTKTFALFLLFPFAAVAQPAKTAAVAGSAQIGPVARQVAMRLSCAIDHGKINNLAVEMDIPDAEKFKSYFDVIPFEGPGALSANMRLTAAAAAGSAQATTTPYDAAVARVDLGSSGWFGNNSAPGTTFTFGAAITPRSKSQLQNLQALAATLSRGTARWSWRIENPAAGQPPIEAIADLNKNDASRLHAAVTACLAAPR